MSRIDTKLAQWQEAGLLTESQTDAIRRYEAAQAGTSWVLYAFAILGAFAIGTGLISLIAANWEVIPIWAKLAADLALLIIIATSALIAHNRNSPIWYEVSLLIFAIFCLASIGLISQVFHQEGSLHGAMLFWCAITAGVFWASRHFLMAWLWLAALSAGLISLLVEGLWHAIILDSQTITPANLMLLGLILPLLYATCWLLTLRRTKRTDAPDNHRDALGVWAILGSLTAVFIGGNVLVLLGEGSGQPSYALPALALAGVFLLLLYRSPSLRRSQQNILAACTAASLLPFGLLFGGEADPDQLKFSGSFAFDLAMWLLLGLFAALMVSFGQKRWFHVFVVLMGLKFIEFYLRAFGGLMLTGIGLVVSGILLIAVVRLWHRYRKSLEAWTEELVS